MNLWRIFFAAVVFLFMASVKAVEKSELSREEKVMNSLLGAHSFDDIISQIRSMSSEERADVVRAVRDNRSGQWGDIRGDVLAMLGLLGDLEERKKAMADFRRQRFYNPELVRLGEPWVIEEIAPDMFLEEEILTVPRSVRSDPPISYGAAGLMIANLQNATIYRDEVLQWAKGISPYNQPAIRGVMRDWWRENEHFFKKKNYQAVKPGRPLELPQPVHPDPQPNSPSVQSGTPQPPLAQSSPAASSPSLQLSPTYRWKLMAVIAALLAFLGTGLWWFQQKKK